VPHVAEEFTLTERRGITDLAYSGEPGTDFGIAGQWWGGQVAKGWEAAVRACLPASGPKRNAAPGPAPPDPDICSPSGAARSCLSRLVAARVSAALR
jgi:hypothetical protein